jgi:hypothetical protein
MPLTRFFGERLGVEGRLSFEPSVRIATASMEA